MRLVTVALVSGLVISRFAQAEYVPGFSLYQHTAASDQVVEVQVGEQGRVQIVATILGAAPADDSLVLEEDLRRMQPEGCARAILFLKHGHPYLDAAGVAWVSGDAVSLLPDNWGWGVCYLGEYRDPTPDEFRRAVLTAASDRATVTRIGAMPRGEARILAASRLLGKARPEVAWYVFDGYALYAQFDLDWDLPVPELGTYLSELRLALSGALKDMTAEEVGCLLDRIGARPPGAVRREHIELAMGRVAASDSFELLRSCYATAVDIEERIAAAHAMLLADPARAQPILLGEATIDEPVLARRLLQVLARQGKRESPPDAVLDAAERIVQALLKVDPSESARFSNLGSTVCQLLSLGRRPADRRLLLAMARTRHSCRAQALVYLREWTGERWEADDPRWDDLVQDR